MIGPLRRPNSADYLLLKRRTDLYGQAMHKIVTSSVLLQQCETWVITIRKEQMTRMSENRMLREMVGAKWRK